MTEHFSLDHQNHRRIIYVVTRITEWQLHLTSLGRDGCLRQLRSLFRGLQIGTILVKRNTVLVVLIVSMVPTKLVVPSTVPSIVAATRLVRSQAPQIPAATEAQPGHLDEPEETDIGVMKR